MPQVPTTEQKQAQHEALVIAKEMAYRQLIANLTVRVHGPQATALQAESAKLHTDFDKMYPSSATQESTSAPAAAQGAGASTSSFTSVQLPPGPTPRTPTTPVETFEQNEEH